MKLDHIKLESFEPFIKDIHKIAFTTGQQFLERNGIRNVEELKTKPNLYKSFIKYCHKGYDIAQKRIVKKVLALQKLKEENILLLKEARRDKNKNKNRINDLLGLIQVINNRILVLRRIMDTIAFTLISGRVWIARRFILTNHIKNIDISAIESHLNEVIWINDKDRLKFAVITDLTTFIDTGDLLQINFRKTPAEWEIIELKSGTVNKILNDIIEKEGKDLEEEKIADLKSMISEHAPGQLRRMLKQRERLEQVIDVIKESKGFDIQTGKEILLSKDELVTESYDAVLINAVQESNTKGYSVRLVDNCLYVIATKNLIDSLHIIYHLMNPKIECELMKDHKEKLKTEREIEEIRKMRRNPFIVDLANNNMYSKSSSPFFLYPFDAGTLFDLLFDRIKLVLFLDINQFAELCAAKGYKLEQCSAKETAIIVKEYGRKHVPLYEGKLIRIVTPAGIQYQLLGGTFHKIFFDLIRPSEILRMWELQDEEMFNRLRSEITSKV